MEGSKIILTFWILISLFLGSCGKSKNAYLKEKGELEVKNEDVFPNKDLVYKDLERILFEDEMRISIDTSSKNVIYFLGSFTGKGKKECLTVLPEIFPKGRINSNPILLYTFDEKGWIYGGWKNLYSNVKSDSIQIFDVNQDSISEFVLKYTIVGSGIYGEQIELVSLKDHNEKILYSNESIDISEARAINSWSKGDTIFERIHFELKQEHQNVPVINEDRTIGLFKNTIGDSLIIEERKTRSKIRLSLE